VGDVATEQVALGPVIDEPRGKGHRRHRRGLCEGQTGGLEGDVGPVDGDRFREGAGAQITRTRVDLVPDREVANVRPDLGDHPRRVVPEDEGPLVPQQPLELAVAEHRVQRAISEPF